MKPFWKRLRPRFVGVRENPVAPEPELSAPVFTSGSTVGFSVYEDQNFVTAIGVTGTPTPSLSITSGGADGEFFLLDPPQLSLLAPLDYDSPQDSDTNNTYVVEVTATNSEGSATQTITVTVLQVAPVGPLDTTVLLSADSGITPTSTEKVTFGLPIAEGLVTDLDDIRVRISDVEIPIAVAGGLTWHWKDGSYRSVTIQCEVDMTGGDVTLQVDSGGRNTTNDITPFAIDDGWHDSGITDRDARALKCPRIFALQDLDYVAGTGILPPYTPPATDDGANTGFMGEANNNFAVYDYAGNDSSAWLFDRASALFKLSLQVRSVANRKLVLKHAAISKRHYFNYVVETQQDSRPTSIVPYWWDLKRQVEGGAFAYGTTMYQNCQNAKLAWALLGDDTQWDSAMLLTWAESIRNAAGSPGTDYTSAYDSYVYPGGFTERLAGLPSLFHLVAWEMTGDEAVRANLDKRIAFLKDMQQTQRPHEVAEGWALSGAFRHSWAGHDATEVPDYVASPTGTFPIGTTELTVTTHLSDFDVPRFIGKGFNIAGNSARNLTNAVDNLDGTWTWTISPALTAAISAGSFIHCRSNINQAPYVEADQVISGWMSVFIADFLWQAYHLIQHPDVPEMLRQLGNCINERGFLSIIGEDNATFTRDVTSYGGTPGLGYNRNRIETYPLYLFSDLTPRNVSRHAASTDAHTELILLLALARHFETDPGRQARLEARIAKIETGMFHEEFYRQPPVTAANSPARTIAWQHSAMPYRTWKWIEGEI